MPSVSKKQQKFMGIVRSIQKGEQPASKFSKDAQDAAKKMKKSSVKKYAKTKHDDLPIKKEGYSMRDLGLSPFFKKLNPIQRQAVSIALIMGGNMTGAIKAIEKIKKGLSKDKKVKNALRMANESIKESLSKSQIKKMRDEFDKTGELPPHLKKISKAKKEFEKKFKVKDVEIPGLEWMSKLGEAADRDYKAEYKKFQSSTKAKKYRAELNKYNRQKGTYGNGDGKDASHKGGKIVGFEKESTNRGRAEKSRLKKEDVQQEIDEYLDGILEDLCLCEACQKGYMTHPTRKTKIMFGKRYRNCIKKEDMNEAVYKLKRGSTNKDLDELDALLSRAGYKGTPDFNKMTWTTKDKNAKITKIIKSKGGKKIKESIEEADLGLTYKKGKTVKVKHKTSGKSLVIIDKPNVRKEYEKIGFFAEGTCGYGIDGKIGEEPAGPNLMKKIKKISKDKEKKKILKSKKEGVNERLNQSQAKTLLRQLGGNKFIVMTGAKQMSIGKDGLMMKIGRNSKSITHVAIDLDRGKDLYTMKFIRVRKGIPKVVKKYDSIYADNLNNIFEKETGLYTRL